MFDRSGELCSIVASSASDGTFLSKSGALKPYIETRLCTKSIPKKFIGHKVSSVMKCHKKKQVCKTYRGSYLFDYRKRAILASKVFISQLSRIGKSISSRCDSIIEIVHFPYSLFFRV